MQWNFETTTTIMAAIAEHPQMSISPLDALMAHFASTSKSVQRTFAKYIVETYAIQQDKKVSQQKMVEDSLTRAFAELKAGEARPIDELLAEL